MEEFIVGLIVGAVVVIAIWYKTKGKLFNFGGGSDL